ncbi:Asp-tRNA(Asn)/Glu-tRNA(Gln) amidotransferase subunit GatC [Pedobacter sp. MC2016-14]|uniref:Asp-tRNA(Asn)/Glu-tRNA(Gln) amidotransferase subunit GatC n=1 Tax=Pedobacter sp. MC2016-14 TaxID=2897327 RepID=UPI001E4A5D6D|nr:Asp-tRNA(Asn)/Glu-tRNA(Gln) amidotransferase subunit GatC [Pedobacter sp. MC2016-14]MCD0489010.1 Asp-tRNA(Asn)/Glu-tRNA(Gln) amidotransferase subunit GatC [Pedobacter sp. MC2016-14]
MKIDTQTIHKVADLARINIQEGEVDTLITEMSKILTFMEKLNELDTTGVKPLIYMNEEVNVWRADEVIQEITVKEGLKNAAVHNENYFMVPKVIEK